MSEDTPLACPAVDALANILIVGRLSFGVARAVA